MKVNFQKIIAVCVTACICLSLLTVNVFAENTGMTNVVKQIENIVNDNKELSAGNISEEEYNERMNRHVGALGLTVTSDFMGLTGVMNLLTKCGIDTTEFWHQYYGQNMGGVGGGGNRGDPDVDMKGYGALLIKIDKKTNWKYYYYGEYGEFYNNSGEPAVSLHGPGREIWFKPDGSASGYDTTLNNLGFAYSGDTSTYAYKFYGDWRYRETGSPADDKTTDINYTIPPLEEQDEETIYDFLDDLINKLKLQYPDLSTIEGLLASIYNRLGTLDSDNDNELLSQVLTAIQALQTSGCGGDNTELINALNEIKNKLVFGEGDNISSLAELLKTLIDNQLIADDFVIDEDAYNQRGEVLKLRLLGKFGFIESLKSLIAYMMTSYSSSASLPALTLNIFDTSAEMDFSWLTEHLPLFQAILAAYIYISYAFHTYRKIPSYINGGDNE